MFIIKNKYFLIIENIKDIDLKNIKIRNKFYIIYRNNNKINDIISLLQFRQICKLKAIKFIVANDIKLAVFLKSDGIYLSSHNKKLKFLNFKKFNFEIIGSAHTFKEITCKIKQGCSLILLSKLFLVDYDNKSPYKGVVRFNNYAKFSKNLIPLGGIKTHNLNYLNIVYCRGFALMSEVKKKPANIINRLF